MLRIELLLAGEGEYSPNLLLQSWSLMFLSYYSIAFRKDWLPLLYWSNFFRPFPVAVSCNLVYKGEWETEKMV